MDLFAHFFTTKLYNLICGLFCLDREIDSSKSEMEDPWENID